MRKHFFSYFIVMLALFGFVSTSYASDEIHLESGDTQLSTLQSTDDTHWYQINTTQDNGDVYFYELNNINKKIYTATKLTSVSNVIELVNFSYVPVNEAGGEWGILAITQDNEYIQIAAAGV